MNTILTLLFLFMSLILPASYLDSSHALDGSKAKFLPYQLKWIEDDFRMRLAEKSVRIGWTYCDAFKNVRKRLHHDNRDYLFATKDQASSLEYLRYCLQFCQIYNLTKFIVSHGEVKEDVPVFKDGKATGVTEEVTFNKITFDTGSRIIGFSSNANAMLVYGGDVGIDEFPAHPQQDVLWETGQGRITMGYDIGVWGAHRGVGTLFNQFAKVAAAGKGGWSHHRVTMADAIDQGYLDMLFDRTGKRWTKEAFLQDCRDRSIQEDIFQQAYMCNPRGDVSAAVPWATIELCAKPYVRPEYERAHLEAEQVIKLFGKFVDGDGAKAARVRKIHAWLLSNFSAAAARRVRHAFGFDVAASGQGDLCAMYTDERDNGKHTMRALLTMRTDDWHFMETCARWFLTTLTDIKGCGDETGLGRQICWNLANAANVRFTPVNFSSSKHDMGFAMSNQMATADKVWPVEEADISQDMFALTRTWQNKRWVYSEGSNVLNPASHCDIAWAAALATEAGKGASGPAGASGVDWSRRTDAGDRQATQLRRQRASHRTLR